MGLHDQAHLYMARPDTCLEERTNTPSDYEREHLANVERNDAEERRGRAPAVGWGRSVGGWVFSRPETVSPVSCAVAVGSGRRRAKHERARRARATQHPSARQPGPGPAPPRPRPPPPAPPPRAAAPCHARSGPAARRRARRARGAFFFFPQRLTPNPYLGTAVQL